MGAQSGVNKNMLRPRRTHAVRCGSAVGGGAEGVAAAWEVTRGFQAAAFQTKRVIVATVGLYMRI